MAAAMCNPPGSRVQSVSAATISVPQGWVWLLAPPHQHQSSRKQSRGCVWLLLPLNGDGQGGEAMQRRMHVCASARQPRRPCGVLPKNFGLLCLTLLLMC